MNAFEAYKLYLALKRHFSSSYDYFKYNGKTNASQSAFETRKDKYSFHKLSKRSDPLGFIISNIVEYGSNIWIGELLSENKYEETYKKWLKEKESRTYCFSEDLLKIGEAEDFGSSLQVEDGQYPRLLSLYLRKKISIETIIILDSMIHFLDIWNKKIEDTALWPEIYRTCIKYSPFIEYDKAKIKTTFKKYLES